MDRRTAETLRLRMDDLPPAEPVADQQAENILLRQHLAAYETSTVWRATWPLRRTLGDHPGIARHGRRALKAVWWTATLQWPARLRERAARPAVTADLPEPPVAPASTPAIAPLPITPEPVRLATSLQPVVSIIVTSFGHVPATLRCLAAIAAFETTTPFEVIVADDASGDPELDALDAVEGLRVIRNLRNLGFLRNCNETALVARGRYLLFLNNDTEPCVGFLDALVRLIEARPDAGLVGSKLLFADGRLQEAGGIVWRDASGWNYGRGDDPGLPAYNTVRETDYLSGASILLRRDLFEQLGGFDPAFAPAYYEDTDLAFRIRARGMAVLYQPASVVVHHEGLSHGTDITAGVKAHQEINRLLMLERWPRMLAAEHAASGTDILRASRHALGRKAILVIDHYVPEPDRDAGSRSVMAILEALRHAGWVVLFWPQNRVRNDYGCLLETIGIEVLDDRLPMGFTAWIARHGAALDHVLVLRPTVAAEFVSDLLRHTPARLSFYGLDIHHARMRRQAALLNDGALAAEAVRMAILERRLWGVFDGVLCPSEEEAAEVRTLAPGACVRAIVPFCYDRFSARTAPPAGFAILFVAGFAHPPNIDAAHWLVGEILPRVQAMLPDATLVLAGSNPTNAIRALGDGRLDIIVTGSLSESALAALYGAMRVALVPLRIGAGVKGKVVEALQQGLPLVTTSVGAQGLPGLETVVPVLDEAGAIAAALVALLQDDPLWVARSREQAAYAERHFSRAVHAASLFAALESDQDA